MMLAVLFLVAAPTHYATWQDVDARRAIVRVERIWDRSQHNAFTDLIEHQGALICAFREGSGHVPGKEGTNGTVRVIASGKDQNWTTLVTFDEEGVDLRDPKLSVTPDDRLMVVMAGSYYAGETLVRREPKVGFLSLLTGATEYFPAQIDADVRTDTDWLWRVTWSNGVGYGIVYQPGAEGEWGLQLVKTSDGVDYELVTTLALDGKPNETTLRFLSDDTLVAVVRREGGDRMGRIGQSAPPYTEWTWAPLDIRLGGPNLLVLADGRLLLGTRDHSRETSRTSLFEVVLTGETRMLLTLPSGGDNSYPGFVLRGDRLLMSYYSSHEARRASIYLATLRVDALKVE